MPGVQISGKPSSAAAGGSSFHESMLRAGISDGGGSRGGMPNGVDPASGGGLSANGLSTAFSHAAVNVRLLGTAARTTATALTQLQAKINSMKFPSGGGGYGGNGGGYGAPGGGSGNGGSGGQGSRPNPPGRLPAGRSGVGYGRNIDGRAVERLGRHGGISDLTGEVGLALENPVGAGIVAAGAAVFAPQIMAAGFAGFMGATSPYRNFAMSAYGVARGGGFNGDSFISDLSDNGTAQSRFMMAQLKLDGLGSTDAMQIMGQYGIGAKSAMGFVGDARALGAMALDSNLGSMDQGQLIGVQRMLTGAGTAANGGNSITQNSAAMSAFLADATSKGLDKSTMIQSMTNSLTAVASAGGLGANLSSAIGFNQGLFGVNNAAARDGSSSASLSAAISAALNNPFGSPARGMMLMRAANSIHSAGDIARLIGPKAYAALTAGGNTGGLMELNGLLDPSTPSSVKAATLGNIMTSDSNAAFTMIQNWASNFSSNPSTQAIAIAGMLPGTNIGTVDNGIAGLENTSGAYLRGQDSNYRAKLVSMGISPAQAGTLIAAAKASGISPIMLGGQYIRESSAGTNMRWKPHGANGPFQFEGATWKQYGGGGNIMNLHDAAFAAARYDAALGMKIDPAGALTQYGGETDGKGIYAGGVFAAIDGGKYNGGAPVSPKQQSLLDLAADNSNVGLQGAKATFVELKGSVDGLAQAVSALQGAVTRLNSLPAQQGMGRHPVTTAPLFTGQRRNG